MKRIKVFYKGVYDDGDCEHYIYAENRGDYLLISFRQWQNCLKNRKIGGVAGVYFDTKIPVYVEKKNQSGISWKKNKGGLYYE